MLLGATPLLSGWAEGREPPRRTPFRSSGWSWVMAWAWGTGQASAVEWTLEVYSPVGALVSPPWWSWVTGSPWGTVMLKGEIVFCCAEFGWDTGMACNVLKGAMLLWGLESVGVRSYLGLFDLDNASLANEWSVATFSLLSWPSTLPTPTAVISPSTSSTHFTGAVRNNCSDSGDAKSSTFLTAGSKTGIIPHRKSKFPPYFLGILSISIKALSVGNTSWWPRMKILEVVMGSNHFLIQPQTVGKNEGAPMIYAVNVDIA